MSTLGDVLQKIILNIYMDIKQTLLLISQQDPELRTIHFKQFIQRSKKKLLQYFVLLKWLSIPNIMKSLNAITAFKKQLYLIEMTLNRNTDEMYFIHGSIYNMRSRLYNVKQAADLLAHKTYHNLPKSIFTCGQPSCSLFIKDIQSNNQEEKQLKNDLDIYLQAKLVLNDPIPIKELPIQYIIKDGVLIIDYAYYFKLYLTLHELSITSSWNVLGCKLFNESSNNTIDNKQQLDIVEKDLCSALRKIISDNNEYTTINTDTNIVNSKSCILKQMLYMCRHIAISVNLRKIYLQIIQTATSFSMCRLDENINYDWVESIGTSYLSIKFWKSLFNNYQFELRVHQPRVATKAGSGLIIEVLTTLSYTNPTFILSNTGTIRDMNFFVIPDIENILLGESFISQDPTIRSRDVVIDTIGLCMKAKLKIIKSQLIYTMCLKETLYSNLMIHSDESYSSITINHRLCDDGIKLILSIDARNGKVLLDSKGLKNIKAIGNQSIESFIRELNNIDNEKYISNMLLKSGIMGNNSSNPFANITIGILAISTFDIILQLLELAYWTEIISKCLDIGNIVSTKNSIFKDMYQILQEYSQTSSNINTNIIDKGIGLVFNIQYWEVQNNTNISSEHNNLNQQLSLSLIPDYLYRSQQICTLPSKNLIALYLVIHINLALELLIGCTLCKYTISNSSQSSRPKLIDAKILYDTQNPINLYDKSIQKPNEFIKSIIESTKTWAYSIISLKYSPTNLLSMQDTMNFSSKSFCSFSESLIGIHKTSQISFLFDTILDCESILNNMKSFVDQTNGLPLYLNTIESIRVDTTIQIEFDSNQHLKQAIINDLNVLVLYKDMKTILFPQENIILYKEYSKLIIKSILSTLINKNENKYYDQNISCNKVYRDSIALSCGMLHILWYIIFKDSISYTENINKTELHLLLLLNIKILHVNTIANNDTERDTVQIILSIEFNRENNNNVASIVATELTNKQTNSSAKLKGNNYLVIEAQPQDMNSNKANVDFIFTDIIPNKYYHKLSIKDCNLITIQRILLNYHKSCY